jgi:putative tricarboxylic transport membrane protein
MMTADESAGHPVMSAAWSRRGSDRPLLPRLVSARAGGIATAVALAAIGLWFVWQASLLDLGDFELPGPGFFPLVLGAAVFICASFLAARLWAASPRGEAIAFGHRDVLIVIGALFAVPLLFDRLGALITLGLFGAVVLVLVARCSLWLAALSAAVAMVACWYFFQVALGLQLPAGFL